MPAGVVTVTSTVVWSVPGGETAVTWVADTAVKLAAGVAPNFTAVAPDRLIPEMVTEVPPAAGPDGGLTLFDSSALGITQNKTFLTGNVGGGLKWFSRTGRWGLRGDYRFLAVRSDATAPAFFGQETRYGHRVYGGVLINAVR